MFAKRGCHHHQATPRKNDTAIIYKTIIRFSSLAVLERREKVFICFFISSEQFLNFRLSSFCTLLNLNADEDEESFPLRSPPASSDERGYKKDAEKKQKRLKNWIRYFYLFVMFIAFLCAIHKPIPVMLLSLNASKANHKINKIKTKVSLFREMPRVWLKGGNDFKDLADIFSLQNYLKPPLNYITPQLLHFPTRIHNLLLHENFIVFRIESRLRRWAGRGRRMKQFLPGEST